MATLDEDLVSPEFQAGVEQGFWELRERNGDVVYIALSAPDERTFLAQMDCSSYGTLSIRCLFVDPATKQVDLKYWPQGNNQFEQWVKFKGNPPFICWPQDRGAIDIGRHADWGVQKLWQNEKNQIVSYLDFLRRLLHLAPNGYSRQKSNTITST